MKHLYMLLLCVGFTTCYGQETRPVHDAAGIKKIIFEDDFSGDSIGTFPKKWKITPIHNDLQPDNGNGCMIVSAGKKHAFSVAKSKSICFESIYIGNYKHDEVHIDFDFLLEDVNAAIALCLSAKNAQGSMRNYTTDATMWLQNEQEQGIYLEPICWDGRYWKIPDKHNYFSAAVWHQFSMTSCEGTIKCYIDHFRVFSVVNTEYVPASAMFCLTGQLKIAAVRVFASDNFYTFSNITNQNKLITYAIHFDVDASTIKQESEKFMHQLADWLKANPTINLEIGGHTDNDGGDAHNLQLSQQRADAVRAMLVSLGISEARLTTKGYGATKPLKPNATPEGKAENRRVEFIRK